MDSKIFTKWQSPSLVEDSRSIEALRVSLREKQIQTGTLLGDITFILNMNAERLSQNEDLVKQCQVSIKQNEELLDQEREVGQNTINDSQQFMLQVKILIGQFQNLVMHLQNLHNQIIQKIGQYEINKYSVENFCHNI